MYSFCLIPSPLGFNFPFFYLSIELKLMMPEYRKGVKSTQHKNLLNTKLKNREIAGGNYTEI